MSELSDAVDEVESEFHRGPQCRACLLPPDLLAEVNDLLLAGKRPTHVARALNRLGHEISSQSVVRHWRRGHVGADSDES